MGRDPAYNGDVTRLTRAWAVFVVMAAVVAAGCSDADEAEPPAVSSPSDTSAGTYHVEVEVGERTYDIYTPPTHDLSPLAPAVIAFHGRPGSPDTIRRESGLETLADEMGFLAVFPRGENQRWEPESTGADITYVEDVIEDLVGSWGADPDRIYVTGYSNGADMAIVSSLVLTDRVAAVAPVTPSGTGSVRDVIDEFASPVPVIAFIGETDEEWAEPGMELLAAWRSGVGCDDARPDDSTGGITTTNWTCDDQPFRVHVVAEQGHVWFGSPEDREPLWASEVMWDFFDDLA
jgi:polyhydroxybutyrate depolymerase